MNSSNNHLNAVIYPGGLVTRILRSLTGFLIDLIPKNKLYFLVLIKLSYKFSITVSLGGRKISRQFFPEQLNIQGFIIFVLDNAQQINLEYFIQLLCILNGC